MKKSNIILLFAIGYLLFATMGCGYSTRAYVGPYKTIYVAPFKNSINIADAQSEYARYKTYYPLLESTITQKVVDRFIFDGSLRISREEDADLVIRGELVSYERGALRYAANNEDVTEYRITLLVNIGLYNGKDGKLIWQKNNFAGDTSYFTTGSQAKSEKTALDAAVVDLARRITEAVVEAW